MCCPLGQAGWVIMAGRSVVVRLGVVGRASPAALVWCDTITFPLVQWFHCWRVVCPHCEKYSKSSVAVAAVWMNWHEDSPLIRKTVTDPTARREPADAVGAVPSQRQRTG
jgi:hypothetical protein